LVNSAGAALHRQLPPQRRYHDNMASGDAAEPQRTALIGLRNGLLRLHKVIMDSERGTYEREIARIRSSGHFLELVMHDPWFAWLHELSQLIVLIDETLASDEPLFAEDADRLRKQARSLLVPAEEGRGFAKHYFEALQRDPAVILAHGEMMKVFAALEAKPQV
jgi:hypothetical protein